ncbi:MAG: efflux RND transporter periplasmic adaptor subunit [Candidatus Cyclobacteriaceae bacterium M3_2C_046]
MKTKKKNSSKKVIFILLGVVVLLIVVAMVGKSAGWIGKPSELEVEFGKAKRVAITEVVSASGTVQPVTEVKISPDVPGEIISIFVEEGDSVVAGQTLIKIRPDNFESALDRAKALLNQQRANLAQAEAAEAKAKAQFIRAELEYKRNQELFEEKVISQSDWELAEANYQIAKNDFEAAQKNVLAARYVVQSAVASVKEAEENLSFTTILAPMSGTVSKLSVEEGERVVGTSQQAGTEMLRIADLTNMEVRVDVNENDIIRISLNDTAQIEVDSYTYLDKEFEGVVTQIANTANEKASPDAVTEFEVRIKILNESYQDLIKEQDMTFPFRPGMTASVDIITNKKEDVLAVPLAAVTTRNPSDALANENGDAEGEEQEDAETDNSNAALSEDDQEQEVVFINEDGTAKMVQVKTGISDFEFIEIDSGLTVGQEVIKGPFNVVSKRLKQGDLVKKAEKN